MATAQELEERISKLETKNNIYLIIQIIIIPLIVLFFGYWEKNKLQEQVNKLSIEIHNDDLIQKRYDLSADLIPSLFDDKDAKKCYLTFHLVSKIDANLGNDIKPMIINWKLNEIVDYINNKEIKKAIYEITAAEKMGFSAGKAIIDTFRTSKIYDEQEKEFNVQASAYASKIITSNATSENKNTKNTPATIEKNQNTRNEVNKVIKVAQIIKSKQSKLLVDKIMKSNIVTTQDNSEALKQTSQIRKGWLFVGTFNPENGTWETKYIADNRNLKPNDLTGKSFYIRGVSNIREGKPTEIAEFLPITTTLNNTNQVKISRIEPWSTSNYYWAEVTY